MIFRGQLGLLGRVALVLLIASLLSACISKQAVTQDLESVEVLDSREVIETQTSVAVVAEPTVPDSEQVVIVIPEPQPEFDQGDVIWIQQRLQDLGYYNGSIDGSANSATRQAIKTYQNDQAIDQDGRPTTELREFIWRNGG